MPDWTPAQLQAIRHAGGSVLVSAAAGSGKTSVLAERCVHLVCDAADRCDTDRLLVVTFTEAAAAEMKSRIAAAMHARLARQPDAHLARQAALLEHARIGTLHSFCAWLLRRHFAQLGIDPDFRVLDENEAALLRRDLALAVVREAFERPGNDGFRQLFTMLGDMEDRAADFLLHTHDLMNSLPDGEQWLRRSVEAIEEAGRVAPAQSEIGRRYLELAARAAEETRRGCAAAIAALARLGGFDAYEAYLRNIESTAANLHGLLSAGDYDRARDALRSLESPRLPPCPARTPARDIAKMLVDDARNPLVRGEITGLLRFDSDGLRRAMAGTVPAATAYRDLVLEFDRRYRQEKDALRAVDFADLEHMALAVLAERTETGFRPSPAARELHEQFRHVLVDEYQDINEVQDSILHMVSRECVAEADGTPANLFCVGDVKQSIYAFRLAEPQRFLQRSERFRRDAAAGAVIDLQQNFRSRAPLLEAVNAVFERLMVAEAVDIEYDLSHRLHPGAQFEASDARCFAGAPVELHVLPGAVAGAPADDDEPADGGDWEAAEREALLVARLIGRMMGQDGAPHRMHVVDRAGGNAGPRPIEYRDIVILLRSVRRRSADYAAVLEQQGIPVFCSEGTGYFNSTEVQDVIALLNVLDNPLQDVPLAALLRSPLAGLPRPDESLATIRAACAGENAPAFHEAVTRYAADRTDDLALRLRDLLSQLAKWRDLARQRPLADVIWMVYEQTGYLTYCAGLPNGAQRCANLIALHERARQFGGFLQQSLYRFVQFLGELDEKIDVAQAPQASAADNVVRIMSIHKAKGLEFPVVIIPEMGKRMNMQGCGDIVLADRHAGIGLRAVDFEKRVHYPSMAWTLVNHQLIRQTKAEELRVLYVAMTRAREHLVLIGTADADRIASWRSMWADHRGPLPPTRILAAGTMLDWVGPVAAATERNSPQPISIIRHDEGEVAGWIACAENRRAGPAVARAVAALGPLPEAPPPDATAQQVIDRLSTPYGFAAFTSLEAAKAVTAWTEHRPAPSATTGDDSAAGASDDILRPPACAGAAVGMAGVDRGTAAHQFLEHLDFSRPCTDEDLREQLEQLVRRRLLSREQADAVSLDDVRWFLDTDIGRALRCNAAAALRELPFYYAMPPDRFGRPPSEDPADQVMMRGRVDLLIPDGEGYAIVDYKTDRTDADGAPRRAELYRGQMELYCEAIGSILRRPVDVAHLVFLSARRVVTLRRDSA